MQSCLTQQSLIDIVLHLTRLLLQIGKEPVVNFREFLSVLSNGSSTRNFMFTGRSHVRRIELVVRYLLSGSNERAHVRKLVALNSGRWYLPNVNSKLQRSAILPVFSIASG